MTRIPVTSCSPASPNPIPPTPTPSTGGPGGECETDNLVEEVYISKHDCDTRGEEKLISQNLYICKIQTHLHNIILKNYLTYRITYRIILRQLELYNVG